MCNALTITLTCNAGKDLVAEVTLGSRKNARSGGEQKVRHSIQLAHHAASVTWSSLRSGLVYLRCRPFIIHENQYPGSSLVYSIATDFRAFCRCDSVPVFGFPEPAPVAKGFKACCCALKPGCC
jgi:hypothetical protein